VKVYDMPAKPKHPKQTPAKITPERRRARWPQVPDLRDPRVRADLRREATLLAQHPENAAIDAWIDAVYDWSEWK
jgi:hypothetical protein